LIDAHFEAIEKAIIDDPLVLSFEFQRTYTSLENAYIKGEVTFIDGSSLAVFQHIRIEETNLVVTDYIYHYMTSDKKLIFRYDNAPHHPEIYTFPEHKHLPSGVEDASLPVFKDVLDEVNIILVDKLIHG
jgi:hypothetical protein